VPNYRRDLRKGVFSLCVILVEGGLKEVNMPTDKLSKSDREELHSYVAHLSSAQHLQIESINEGSKTLREFTNLSVALLVASTTVFTLDIVKTDTMFNIGVSILVACVIYCIWTKELYSQFRVKKSIEHEKVLLEITKTINGKSPEKLHDSIDRSKVKKPNFLVKKAPTIAAIMFVVALIMVLSSIAFKITVSF
jgi:hypothetical protein